MLSDIIRDIVKGQADMDLVGAVSDLKTLPATVVATDADVVVAGLPNADLPEDYLPLFHTKPRVRLLGVSADGRRGFLYVLRPQWSELGELSPSGLIDAIRATQM